MDAGLFFTIFGPIIGLVLIGIIVLIVRKIKEANVRDTIHQLAANEIELTPEEFFKMRKIKGKVGKGVGSYSSNFYFEGVYILYNETKNMYYVGQGIRVLDRVNSHFTGKGNGDVYADYKYGDSFKIKMISLENSGYDDLNKLEFDTIKTYKAFSKGYNKTSGNKSPSYSIGSTLRKIQYDDDDSYEDEPFDDGLSQKFTDWDKNRSKYEGEKDKAIEKIKKYIKTNDDWCLPTKNMRINFFYLNKNFSYKKAATWPEFCDKNLEYVNAPLTKGVIESIIEPYYIRVYKPKLNKK